ncbi:hypothetical protein BBO99_00001235 [Phytophthora kernoviae]|uniref:Uncharacterized protein n=2 Tax=Phytophthora kernoviae TaxID=325452 RepID=A0A3R7JYD1_9STRA|nr:hypothetical protein G195_005359 [Phytophthora kernoviae 00238/432]KAG2525216.1 hypothetical protein JM16_004552 [Phytophthora kernoviae]KAG2526859.1 hypothetical protein JM18_004128 [Phytophthora kernoviae]RLN14842.1 hypothetical protein BBI17_004642 [Phytophthora kernoviae]RLN84561.1 hypothetical protein BBO99_00001235 [Phytophthora kernoviae]
MAENGILSGFLPALTEQISESVVEVTGELENALHQQLESTGNKRKQAWQLNTVSKGSGKYMSKVHRAFVKNFDKFELYVRRNIVSVPEALADEVTQIRAEKLKEGKGDGQMPAEEYTALLSKEEKEEHHVDAQLDALRLRLRELTASNQRLEFEQKALDERTQHFQGLVTQVAFLDDVPERTISPWKRTSEHISSLHDAFLQMDSIQAALEEDSRQFKRSKVATRGSFRNLRKRFTARTSEMTFRTTEDLQELHSKLLTM